MDWSKAKSILIILFLLLNLFLVSSIVFNRSNNSMEPNYVKAAEQILADRQIQVEVPLPEYQEDSGWIDYDEEGFKTGRLAIQILGESTFSAEVEMPLAGAYDPQQERFTDSYTYQKDSTLLQIEPTGTFRYEGSGIGRTFSATTVEEMDKQLREWFAVAGMDRINLHLEDAYQDKGFLLTYVQTHRDFALFQNRLLVRVQNGQMTTLRGNVLPVQKENAFKSILSVQQLLIMSKLPKDSVVSDIQFGWASTEEGELYDNPVWRLTLSENTEYYYLATTGEMVLEVASQDE